MLVSRSAIATSPIRGGITTNGMTIGKLEIANKSITGRCTNFRAKFMCTYKGKCYLVDLVLNRRIFRMHPAGLCCCV